MLIDTVAKGFKTRTFSSIEIIHWKLYNGMELYNGNYSKKQI